MKKKIKSSRGVSILEMLIALLLMSLLSAGGVAATTAVMSDYNHMGEAANAEILASTVIETISNEVRLGHDISVVVPDPTASTGECLALDSAFFGENTELKLEDKCLIAETKDSDGNLVAKKQVLSEDAYSGLHLKDLTFEKVDSGTPAGGIGTAGRTVFMIGFTVYSDHSNELWKGSVSAAPMVE